MTPRWLGRDGYKNFLADLGPRGEGMSLDRIDVHGHYEPENCRWVTWDRQVANRQRHADPPYGGEEVEGGPVVEPKWPELVVKVPPIQFDRDDGIPF